LASYNFLPQIQNSTSTTSSAPGGPQAGALNTIYSGLSDAYNKSNAMGPYSGNFYAGSNPFLDGAYNFAGNFAQGNAANVANNQINTGQGLMANYGTATNAANGLYNFANQNTPQANINAANQYAQNPYIDQAVNAATYNANRSAAENDIPNLYRGAAASGNINSDRAALAQGVIGRGLAENAQNIGASMRQNAWNTGLNANIATNNQNMGALANAGSLGANLGGAGSSMMSQGINDAASLSKLYESAGLGIQGVGDRSLANDYAKYNSNYQFPWQNLNNYYGIAGNNNWWGTNTTNNSSIGYSPVANQPSSPGALGIAGAGLGMAGSIAGLSMGGPAGAAAGGTIGGALAKSMAPSVFGKPS